MADRIPSPSFAQTGAEFTLESSDDDDLRSEVGAGGSEVFELAPRSPSRDRRRTDRDDDDDDDYEAVVFHDADVFSDSDDDDDAVGGRWVDGGGAPRLSRRPSASTVASFQLYTPDEEQAVRRKFDRKLVVFVALLYLLSFLDRSNIGNARIAGMDDDLQTEPPRRDWYDWALTAFYITYIGFEWMSLLWKLVPAHVFVSLIVLTWGLTASLQAVATSYPMLIALRALLGIGEAGFTGIPFYLSFFFRREELAFRTAIFISAAPLATSVASTIAWVIVKFADVTPIAPWRLLFLIEGFPSVVVSAIAWTAIPDSPQTASYLTRREKKVARLRLRNEDDAAAASKPASGLRAAELLAALLDPVAWIMAAMFFLTNMAYSSLPVFLPKIMTEMGHSTLASQALSAPPYLAAFLAVLLTAHLSDRLRARALPLALHALLSALGYGLLALPLRLGPYARYAALFPAAAGFFCVVTLLIAWSVNNQPGSARRGAAFALMQLVGQCGPLLGTRLYPDRDAPSYTPGMRACAAAMLAVAVLAVVLRAFLRYKNRNLDRKEGERAADGGDVEEEGLVGPGKRRRTPAESFRYML